MSGRVRSGTWPGARDEPPGELVAYTVNVGELLHALGTREGGVDVHWRVGLLHCAGLIFKKESTCSAANLRRFNLLVAFPLPTVYKAL